MNRNVNLLIHMIIFFLAFDSSAIKVIEPKDSLSETEINNILSKKNFFHRNDHLLGEGPIWPHLDRKYGQHFFKNRTEYYSLNNIIHRSIRDGFPVQLMWQQLWRGELGVQNALGGLLPRLSIQFAQGQFGVNENTLFTNLFQFVLPQQWFALAQAHFTFHATEYLTLQTLLDQYMAAEIAYLNLHQLIQDFEIRNFYLMHMQLLNQYLGDGPQNDPTLAGVYAQLGTETATNRGNIKFGFIDLAQVIALRSDRANNLAADHLNIENIKDFPSRVAELEEFGRLYNNKEDFIHEVLNRSVELKSIKEFYVASKMGIGITSFGSIFSNATNPHGNSYISISANAGYDTLPKILTSVSQAKTAHINVEQTFVQIVENARKAFDTYTNGLGGYTEAHRSLSLNRKAIAKHLSQILDKKKKVSANFFIDFANLVDAELKLNNALHNALRGHALMRRLLVTEEKYLLSFFPDAVIAGKLRKFLIARYKDEENNISRLDQVLKHVDNPEKLYLFLNGKYKDKSGLLKDDDNVVLEKQYIPQIVSDHMMVLLHRSWSSKLHRNQKNEEYYTILDNYIEDNNIDISYNDKVKMQQRAGQRVQRIEYGTPKHKKLSHFPSYTGVNNRY